MTLRQPRPEFPRCRLVLKVLGALMLLAGIGSLALGPVEMVCFTWFAEGGRFSYEGFGFGSLMFSNMAVQILGYYLTAAVLIPLGYGHLRLRRWAHTVTLALTWCWVVLGVPLLVAFLFILLASKDLAEVAAAAVAALAVLSYVGLPMLLIRSYRGARVQAAFGALRSLADDLSRVTESIGVPVLVVVGLEAFFVVALHVLLFLKGLFPLPAGWATGLLGYKSVDVAILSLLAIGWGSVRRRKWAWWASLGYFATMTIPWVGTLVSTRWAELLDVLAFPPAELAVLGGIPVQGWHLAVLVGLPLTGTLAAIVRVRGEWTQPSHKGTDCVEGA